MKVFNNIFSNTESMEVSIQNTVTVNSLLSKTKSYIGNKFTSYSGYDNNCQTFIDATLQSNGLHNSETKKIIFQDTKHLFKNDDDSDNTKFRKAVNTVTAFGAILSEGNEVINEIKEDPRNVFELPHNDLFKTMGSK